MFLILCSMLVLEFGINGNFSYLIKFQPVINYLYSQSYLGMFKGKHQYTRKNKVKEKDKIYSFSLESPGKFCPGISPTFCFCIYTIYKNWDLLDFY